MAVASGLLGLLIVAQFALPELAENRLSGDLEGVSGVREVDVDAFPAVKLLLGRADRVKVRLQRYRSQDQRLADFIARAGDVDELDAAVEVLEVGPLRLRDARMTKQGDDVEATAEVRNSDLARALPFGFKVSPVADPEGRLVFGGSIEVLGARTSGRAVVSVEDGRIVVTPEVPFGGLLAFEVFGDERLRIEDVRAEDASDGFKLTASGRIEG